MPELPDVEGFRRDLAGRLPGRRVRQVDVRDAGVLRNTTAGGLAGRLTGRRFDQPRRHGKWLILPTDGPTLLIHSGMTGHPYYAAPVRDGEPDRPDGLDGLDRLDRLVLRLDRGELHYADQRKLRGVWLADADQVGAVTGPQGPDALTVDLPGFTEALRGRRGRLKPTLMDQRVIAGLGNLLTDEICWQARLDPNRNVADLDPGELRRLHSTMRRVLRTAVRHGCVPGLRGWLTRVRDDPDPRCPRCGTALRRGRGRGRTTLSCPRCQPA